jgi:hypothetical protein
LSYLAACRNLRYLDVRQDGRWGTYDEINRSNEKWASIPTLEAIAKLESLTVSDSGPCEQILMDLAGIFDLSTLRSLDFDVYVDILISYGIWRLAYSISSGFSSLWTLIWAGTPTFGLRTKAL